MKPEIEAKFLNVDHDALRAKLKEIGATCEQPMRLMRRKNYDYPDKRLEKQGGWVRLRDEGNKVTLAYKQLNDRSLHGTHEVSVVVDDFEATSSLLEAIGLEADSYQETRRESWHLDNFEIELDEWPWIKPFIEFEGPDEASMRHLAQRLGLDWGQALHGSVEIAYQAEYDATDEEIDHMPSILFDHPTPEWLEKRRKK